MKYKHLYTVRENLAIHYIGETPNYMELIDLSYINIYGVPEEWDNARREAAREDHEKAVKIGNIFGCMVHGEEISRQNKDTYELCDDLFSVLKPIVLSLADNNGPLSKEHGGDTKNHYYINEIELNDSSVMPIILDNLTDIIYTHHCTHTDIISCAIKSLPNENTVHNRIDRTQKSIDQLINYPSEYINHEAWQPFLDAGFKEWEESRVLYKEIQG